MIAILFIPYIFDSFTNKTIIAGEFRLPDGIQITDEEIEEILHTDDVEDEDEDYGMVTNLSCPKCKSYVEVFLPKEKE